MEGSELFSSLLNDPAALQSAMSVAASLLGGTGDGSPPAAEPDAPPMPPTPSAPPVPLPSYGASGGGGTAFDPTADLMRTAMPVLGRIAQSGQTAVDPNKRSLLTALKPFVGDKVALQIDHGIKLVSLARMATAALGQLGAVDETSKEGQHV